MINEKKLIEDLRKQGEEYDKDCGDWLLAGDRRNEILCAGKCTGIVQAINIVKNQPQVGTWIPVDERLPKDDNFILLSFDNFSIPMIGRYEKFEDGGGAFYLGDCDEDDTCMANNLFVNAYMPLPDPYRPEECD